MFSFLGNSRLCGRVLSTKVVDVSLLGLWLMARMCLLCARSYNEWVILGFFCVCVADSITLMESIRLLFWEMGVSDEITFISPLSA